MSILDYLSTLASAIGGQLPPPQPQTPSTQQGQPSPQQGGLTGFLSSPLTQGVLGAYFGAIGAPKRSGLGGMLSSGGLTGLGTFNQAEQAQQRQQQAAQQAALTPYKIQQLQAGTGLTQAKAQQLAGIGDANAALAAKINAISSSGSLTPEQKSRADVLATAIANDKTKVYDPNTAIQAIYSEPLKDQLVGAQIKSTQAGTKQKEAEMAAIPSEVALRTAETSRAEAEAAHAGESTSDKGVADWYDPATGEQYRGTQRKPTDKLVSSLKEPKGTDPMVELTRLQTMYAAQHPIASKVGGGVSFEQFAISKGYDPASGEKLPPLSSGTYDWDSTRGVIVVKDASGAITHVYQPD